MQTKFLWIALFWISTQSGLQAQNIPPMIGDHVGKPKIKYPNPLERGQTQKTSESSQPAVTAAAEKELTGFLENWSAQLSRKDIDSLGTHYLQGADLRVYWDSQEYAGWEAFKAELQKWLTSPEGFQLELKSPSIHVFGRFAWITSHYFRQQWLNGRPDRQEGRLTLVLEKRRSVWTILHQHGSAVSSTTKMKLSTK
jgi:ketosteroid isomerase-like protein